MGTATARAAATGMRLYDEFEPMWAEPPRVYRAPIGNEGNGWSLSLRRCPECGYNMMTNRVGSFHCNRCCYHDTQDVSGLDDLKYSANVHKAGFLFGHQLRK